MPLGTNKFSQLTINLSCLVIFIAQISSSNRFLRGACHVSGTLLGTGTMIVNETVHACPSAYYEEGEEIRNT